MRYEEDVVKGIHSMNWFGSGKSHDQHALLRSIHFPIHIMDICPEKIS